MSEGGKVLAHVPPLRLLDERPGRLKESVYHSPKDSLSGVSHRMGQSRLAVTRNGAACF
jgi:hypothetical protein